MYVEDYCLGCDSVVWWIVTTVLEELVASEALLNKQ
jgi:hypothetical protein